MKVRSLPPIIPVMLALTISWARPAGAQNSVPKGEMLERPNWQESSLRVGELTRWYRVYVPRSLPEKAPVVLLLHGGCQSMRRIFSSGAVATKEWADLAETERFLLVVPNGTNPTTGDTRGDRQGWNDGRISGLPGPSRSGRCRPHKESAGLDRAALFDRSGPSLRNRGIQWGDDDLSPAHGSSGSICGRGRIHRQPAGARPRHQKAGFAHALDDRQRHQGPGHQMGRWRDSERPRICPVGGGNRSLVGRRESRAPGKPCQRVPS